MSIVTEYEQVKLKRVNVFTLTQARANGQYAKNAHVSYVVPDDEYDNFLRYMAYVTKNIMSMDGPATTVNLNSFGIKNGIDDFSVQRSLFLRGFNLLTKEKTGPQVRGYNTQCPFLPDVEAATQFFSLAHSVRNFIDERKANLQSDNIYKGFLDHQEAMNQRFLDKSSLIVGENSLRISLSRSKLIQVGFTIKRPDLKLNAGLTSDIVYSSDLIQALYDNCYSKRK